MAQYSHPYNDPIVDLEEDVLERITLVLLEIFDFFDNLRELLIPDFLTGLSDGG